MLTIEQIREKHGPSHFDMDVPEWGGIVRTRRLTDNDYIDLGENPPDSKDSKSVRAYFVRVMKACLINEDGTPLLANGDDSVLRENPLLAQRLALEVLRLNGMLVDEAKKNSNETPPDDSPSDSA